MRFARLRPWARATANWLVTGTMGADDARQHVGEVVDQSAQQHERVAGAAVPDTASGRQEATTVPGVAAPSALKASSVDLASLSSRYREEHHLSYLTRLNKSLEDAGNRNIALTGRYGAGKSSVLDEYARTHKDSTLRLAISSLGPNEEGATLTNRIQKELVKQLIYTARPSTLRHSRFRRNVALPLSRAGGEVAVAVALVGVFLALMGWLPTPVGASTQHATPVRVGAWAALVGVLVAVGTAARLLTHNRFFITEASAAGAKVKLSETKLTYFDEYLDDIVNYFDREKIDVVIFEDLDRFDDPQIFEALRELNTLLNSPERGKRRGGSLRFVYAVRDSLFEQLGADPKPAPKDAATAETVRANRTKFFDVVIPIVPFISHRNARELLSGLLRDVGAHDVERGLVELVARHATDMRLLWNMRNEYLVYAERLLEGPNPAPGLNPTNLFALVAYKNFHLEDFEQIARRLSDLDVLYDDRRALVRHCVSERELRKRELLSANARPRSVAPYAQQAGERLDVVGLFELSRRGWDAYHLGYSIGGEQYSRAQATTAEFWDRVVEAESLSLDMFQNPRQPAHQRMFDLTKEHLQGLFPEMLRGRWEQRNEEAAREEAELLNAEIDFLRGADFAALAGANEYTMPYRTASTAEAVVGSDNTETAPVQVSFSTRVQEVLKSDLARELVRRGYIDRNFTLYAAQFYGDFAGVDVATFIVQTVQTNSYDIDYRFNGPASIANLLREAGSDFTSTVSAFNPQVLDWLLKENHPGADNVVEQLVTTSGDHVDEFLTAYLTSGTERTQLATRLSRHRWRHTFTHLATSTEVPEDIRAGLVDAALLAVGPASAYDFTTEVVDFVVGHYREMATFTFPREVDEVRAAVTLLAHADLILPDLEGVEGNARIELVARDMYALNAPNLRLAASVDGPINLDYLSEAEVVYKHCLTNLDAYLTAVHDDDQTEYAVTDAATLAHVLSSPLAEAWTEGQLIQLLVLSSPQAALTDLRAAPESTWPQLASAKRFDATVANVEAYLAVVGKIDRALGELLLSAGALTLEPAAHPAGEGETSGQAPHESADSRKVAVAILNASEGIPAPADRVKLVSRLGLETQLTATDIKAEPSNLFALLIEAGLVADDAGTFSQLCVFGWAAVGPAIDSSTQVPGFLTPEHLTGTLADALDSETASAKIGIKVLTDLDSFMTGADAKAWAAVARYAVRSNTLLPLERVRAVAANSAGDPLPTLQLLELAAPGPEHAQLVQAALAELGAPYNYISTREHLEFEVPDTDTHRAALQPLADAGILRMRKKRLQRAVTVVLEHPQP